MLSRNFLTTYDPFTAMDKAFFDAPFFADGNFRSFGTDITDEGDHYALSADLPGFDKDAIKVNVKDNTITVSAERHSEVEETDKQGKFLRQERSYGSYKRTFSFGDDIDKSGIRAKYENGVLTLTLPKQEPPVEADIDISVE